MLWMVEGSGYPLSAHYHWTASQIRYGWWVTGINLPSVPDLGTWTIDFQVNESTLIADSFDVALPADCDFTGDMVCDVADIDMMCAQGNLVEDVVADAGNAFDLDGDLDIDNTDLGQWLADAAVENGFTSPFVREDTDDVGPFALRNVDITDFNSVSSNFDAAGNNVPNNT